MHSPAGPPAVAADPMPDLDLDAPTLPDAEPLQDLQQLRRDAQHYRVLFEATAAQLQRVVNSMRQPTSAAIYSHGDAEPFLVVTCRNGAVLRRPASNASGPWVELPPVPGSPAAIAAEVARA